MTTDEIEIQIQTSPREDLIRTAVSFLTNPNVQKSPVSQKEAFLKKKGLTTEEIRIAFERSKVVAVPIVHPGHLVEPVAPPIVQISWFQKIKDFLNTLALLIGGAYGLFYLYKRFIGPFLFGKPKKPKTLESSISSLNKTVEKSISELKNDVQQVQCDIKRVATIQNEQQSSVKQINVIKSEIAIVKGILLSRHQFGSENLSQASIPAWQLARSSHKDDKESLENEDGEHHSGSSETEIVPNPNSNGGSQGSDSSLEMIKEFSVDVRDNLFDYSDFFAQVFGLKIDWDLPSKIPYSTSKGKIQRRDLYQGIEKLFQRENSNGTSCACKLLCEASVLLPQSNHFWAQFYEVIFSGRYGENVSYETDCLETLRQMSTLDCSFSLLSVLSGSKLNINI